MVYLADDIRKQLKPLVGLRLTIARRAAGMRVLHFGTIRKARNGTVGAFALHIQCAWRVEGPEGIVTGSLDLWEPVDPAEVEDQADWNYEDGNLQDLRMSELLGGYDPETRAFVNEGDDLVVESIRADSCGGAELELSGDYRLSLFPDGARGENWRLFQPGTEEPHFIVGD